MSLDSVRAAIIDELMNRQKPVSSHIQVTDDEGDKFRRAATDGILLRYGVVYKIRQRVQTFTTV